MPSSPKRYARGRRSSAVLATDLASPGTRELKRRGGPRTLGGAALRAPRARLLRLDLPVLRRSARDELVEKRRRRGGDRVDRALEGRLVRARGLGEAADLADVLERGRADLLVRRRRIEVVERVDASAHAESLRQSKTRMKTFTSTVRKTER